LIRHFEVAVSLGSAEVEIDERFIEVMPGILVPEDPEPGCKLNIKLF
jgi:hypothetical protein